MDFLSAYPDLFNARELAALVWVLIGATFALSYWKDVWRSTLSVLSSLGKPRIFIPIVLLALWSCAIPYLLSIYGLWEWELVKDALYWFVFTGFILLLHTNKIGSAKNLTQPLVNLVGVMFLLEYILNIYVFHLVVELITIPVIAFAVSSRELIVRHLSRKESEKDWDTVLNLINGILVVYALIVFYYTSYHITKDPEILLGRAALISYLLPVMLTVWSLPYLYIFALLMTYEEAFGVIERKSKNDEVSRYAKKRLMLHFKARLNALSKWVNSSKPYKIYDINDVDEMIGEKEEGE